MYSYHGTSQHRTRLADGRCRCESQGRVHRLDALLSRGLILAPPALADPLSTPQIRRLRSDPEPIGAGYGRTFIFAINEELEICIAADNDRQLHNAVKHETLFHNANVLAAGEICIQNGIILNINDHSASYSTIGKLEADPAFAQAVLGAIARHAFPLDPQLKDLLENLSNP